MAAKTVRVRDSKDREFTMLAQDARRMGYEVLDEPEAPKTSAKPAAEKKPKAAVIDSESAPTSEGTNR
jgi:hypothetical protein